jgi:hypothetical protein
LRKLVIGAVTGMTLLVMVDACKDDPTEAGSGNISDPATFEAEMRQRFFPIVLGVLDGLERVLVAIDGGPADGVVITPTANGVDAMVSIDFDGNGSREGSISSAFIGVIDVGAQLSVTSIETQEPSFAAGGSMSVVQTSPGIVLLDDVGGSGSADPPGSGNAAEVAVSDGAITVDIVSGVASGFVDFVVSGEGNSLSVTAAFEPDGQGGFRVRFTGPGFDFTVP